MKRILFFFLACFWALILYFSVGHSWAEEKKGQSNDQNAPKKSLSETVKGKAQEEVKEVKKHTKEAGREIKESAKELSNKAAKEFKKAGKAAKETGKGLKESFKESWAAFKNLFKE